ncbi:MAG: M1 family metallopeptidase [Bacteroidetes bacterium]|nr:M1 family metallopeptidase [Bacteroidota bacterium]
MIRLIIAFVFSTAFIFSVSAQQLYKPRDIANAYSKGTRSPDGRPGPKYWQNHGRYNITVTAMPPDRTIRGTEQITYVNNSPDTLRHLIIRLVLNIHKPGVARASEAEANYLTNGVTVDKYAVNGQPQRWEDPIRTWQGARLPKMLLPHDSVQISFDWHYDASLQSNREGMIDSTTFFLAYFYPRVSVYDDYEGWDMMDFTDLQEFYNDFNDYVLQVKVPKNYVVWATGDLQNPSEVLQPAIAQRLKASMTTDEILHVATAAEMAAKKVTAQNAMNTWIWTANDISDMTVGLSDHFAWDASSVVVDDATKRRASVQSAYNDTARDYHEMVSFARHSLDWLSHKWPGVPYPFPKTTIFQGYADMEYPMMVNDATEPEMEFARFVVEHEIAHTWFPFYMGINESRYAFMDEGWATTFELLIGREDMGVEKADNFYKRFRVNGWINDPIAEEDIPIITPANALRGAAYGNNAYGKPSLGYLAVKDMLGDELFRKCLHEYISRWHGKHPIPWDFFNTFNNVSGKDLNWFWNNWYFTNYYIDLGIDKVEKTSGGYTVRLKNTGGYAAPVDMVLRYNDGSTETLHQTAELWKANEKQAAVTVRTGKTLESVQLKGGIFMDANESDNTWTSK